MGVITSYSQRTSSAVSDQAQRYVFALLIHLYGALTVAGAAEVVSVKSHDVRSEIRTHPMTLQEPPRRFPNHCQILLHPLHCFWASGSRQPIGKVDPTKL